MTVVVQCENAGCGATYRVAPETLGQSIACRRCGRTFIPRRPPSGQRTRRSTDPATVDTVKVAATPTRIDPPEEARSSTSGELPDRLGRFQIRERLGAGAFGAVYRAYDPELDRDVALKVPQAGTLQSDKAKQRFLREAKAAAQLRHPHIVPVYDAGADGAMHYIASAFIDGETLEAAIATRRPRFREAARIVQRLAEALAYAHRQKVIHRDIKPANIMLDADGAPHVMDFGLARLDGTQERMTHDGTVLGTPAYMSPEQARGDQSEVGPASDQYSLGAVLYELLTGQTPFSGPAAVVIVNILSQPIPPPRSIRAKIPRDLETICLKALAADPSARYADCSELADDLRRWLDDEPIRARKPGAIERAGRWFRRNPLLAGAVGVAAVSLVLGTAASIHFAVRASRQREEAIASAARADESAKQAEASAEELRAALTRVDEEARRAQDAADRANQALQRAEQERRRADVQRDEAQAQTRLASERLEQVRQGAYNAQLARARDAVSRDPKLALAILNDESICPPDQREFTWNLLHSAADPTVATIEVPGIKSVACAPTGSLVAIASEDGISLWDAVTIRELRRISGHPTNTMPLVFSQDGKWLAMGDRLPNSVEPTRIRVFETVTGEERFAINFTHWAHAAVFPSVRNSLTTLDGGGTLTQWNLATGKARASRSLSGFSDSARTAATFSPYGNMLAYWWQGGGVKLLDARKRSDLVVEWSVGDISWLMFSPDHKTLASGDDHGLIRLWDVEQRRERARLRTAKYSNTKIAAFCGSEILVAPDVEGESLAAWDVATGEPLGRLAAPATEHLEFSNDAGILIVHPSQSESLHVVDPMAALMRGHVVGSRGSFSLLAFSPDGTRLARAAQDYIVLHDITRRVDAGDYLSSEKLTEVRALAFSPDGTLLAIRDKEGIRLLNLDSGASLLSSEFDFRWPLFSSDGTHLLALGGTRIGLWDIRDGRANQISLVPPEAVSSHGDAVMSAFSPLSLTVALTSASDKRVMVWDVATRHMLLEVHYDSDTVPDVALSNDGTLLTLATGSRIQLYDVRERHLAHEFEAASDAPRFLFLLPEANALICGGEEGFERWELSEGYPHSQLAPEATHLLSKQVDLRDWDLPPDMRSFDAALKVNRLVRLARNGVELWDLERGTQVALLRVGGDITPSSSAFTPDGATVATGWSDGSIRLWDSKTGHERLVLQGGPDAQRFVAFSPDGRALAALDEEGVTRLWHALARPATKAPASE